MARKRPNSVASRPDPDAMDRVRLDKWGLQVKNNSDFIVNLASTPSMHGIKWQRRMLAHYIKTLKALLDACPCINE